MRDGVEELTARLVAGAERRKVPRDDGAASTAAWLQAQAQARLSRSAAGRAVAHAKAFAPGKDGVVGLEATRRAWVAGAVTADHAMLIAGAVDQLGSEVSAEDRTLVEKVILDEAQVLGVDGTRHVAKPSL